MIEPVPVPAERQCAPAERSGGVTARLRLVTTIVDGTGGALALALTDDGAHLVAHAIGLLVKGQLEHGSVVKVTTSEHVFALSRTTNAAGNTIIRICDVYNPQACVSLSMELAEMVAALLASSERLLAQVTAE